MSSRALRRLQGDLVPGISVDAAENVDPEEDVDLGRGGGGARPKKANLNPFDLVR